MMQPLGRSVCFLESNRSADDENDRSPLSFPGSISLKRHPTTDQVPGKTEPRHDPAAGPNASSTTPGRNAKYPVHTATAIGGTESTRRITDYTRFAREVSGQNPPPQRYCQAMPKVLNLLPTRVDTPLLA
jgi:hypothetical protein